MIDNLISDPMKQIWIDLEFNLEFGYMNFLSFRDFFGFVYEFFLNLKLIYFILILHR